MRDETIRAQISAPSSYTCILIERVDLTVHFCQALIWNVQIIGRKKRAFPRSNEAAFWQSPNKSPCSTMKAVIIVLRSKNSGTRTVIDALQIFWGKRHIVRQNGNS